nr:MAG TPA: hypothetical protein [Caudoviricetes sp.]
MKGVHVFFICFYSCLFQSNLLYKRFYLVVYQAIL